MKETLHIATCSAMQNFVMSQRQAGKIVGFVPTMGALHAGHISLIEAALQECDIAIASIFVNPTQFGPREDFAKYPRTLESDIALLSAANCVAVFCPTAEEMYPTGYSTYVEPPQAATLLEGVYRPGHFRGVCTVVLKLLGIVPAHKAYFGQKDYQQALVLQHMARDLNLNVQLQVCPILRETDGLAMSSRNRYLSNAEREQALALSRGLRQIEQHLRQGVRDAIFLRDVLNSHLLSAGISRIDYATLVHPQTLQELTTIDQETVALIACHVGTTRLIDNYWFINR
jgi:pantoate--beta-alanine ligase